MRTIIHLSDLHFGTETPRIAETLLAQLNAEPADLVAVSGDLTQRAKRREFRKAREFLDQLPMAQIVVPGNHDIPLYNVLARLWRPLARYRNFITEDLAPFHLDSELAVAGVNTARPGKWKEGSISPSQVARLGSQFRGAPAEVHKVLVAHHPFVPEKPGSRVSLVSGAEAALHVLEDCGCELILAGHLHRAYCGDVRPHYARIKRTILVAQAGTAISRRRRNEANAYNRITLDGESLTIEVHAWDGGKFAPAAATRFERQPHGWARVAAA